MVHGLFRASGIVMFYGLHHDFGRRKVGVSLECLGHFCRADVGHFWKAPKDLNKSSVSASGSARPRVILDPAALCVMRAPNASC
jgi:hypothetical protein